MRALDDSSCLKGEAAVSRKLYSVRTQIQDLYGRTVHLERPGHSGECCEINLRRLRVRASQFGHQGGLDGNMCEQDSSTTWE